MDDDDLEAAKRQEIGDRARERAVNEIVALKKRHIGGKDPKYTFECDGKKITGAFVTASLIESPPNAFQIELLVPAAACAEGEAQIVDTNGRSVGASVTIKKKEGELNRVIIQTVALE
jgi:hypothetical protein